MSEFGLIRSFNIDDGQLDSNTKQECFVLGYECAIVDERLKSPMEFSQLLHAENRERVVSACIDAGRQHQVTWMDQDQSESWMMLYVSASKSDEESSH